MKAFRVQRTRKQFPNNEVEQEHFFASYNKAAMFIGDNAHPINHDEIEVDAAFIRDNAADNYWYTVKKVTPGMEMAGMKWPDLVAYFHFIKIDIE